MILCNNCNGDGSQWISGRCICDGWCHTRGECEKPTKQKCYTCKGYGFLEKINIACPICGVVGTKGCKNIAPRTMGYHKERLELARKTAKENWDVDRRLREIQRNKSEIDKLSKRNLELRAEITKLKLE